MGQSPVPGSCTECGTAVPATAAYCPGCGTPVEREDRVACPACRELTDPDARFCSTCGAHMASVGETERRIVTILFADLSGFTPLTEELDAETVHDLIAGCLGPLCDCVTRHGGFVDKFIGDCVMALFGAPVAYENEEERAIRAALDMHAALEEWAEGRGDDPWADAYRPRLTIGINTGPVVTGLFAGGGARNYTAVGDAVNVAARLQGRCEPGRVLVGGATCRNAEHLFEFGEERELRVKGRHEPVRARYVHGLRPERGKLRGVSGVRTPLVGREAEIEELRRRWRRAAAGGAGLCLVVGEPGIGKTRLLEELAAVEGLGGAQVVRGRSYPHARSTPWEPVVELLHDLYRIPPKATPAEAARRIVDAVGGRWAPEEEAALAGILGGPATPDPVRDPGERRELAGATLRRALSWRGPAPRLMILEDLHWADGSTLAFLSGLSTSDLGGPALLALVTRPPVEEENRIARLVEAFPDRIELAPLTAGETRSLVDEILGDHEVDPEAVETIVSRAEGRPLFVEELLKGLMADGSLQRGEDGRWRAAGDWTLAVPDTIESVLSTRIDALRPAAKRALQQAAIVGRRFWSGVLSEELVGSSVQDELRSLVEGAFVHARPDSLISEEPEYAFEHLMLHEVAYEGILRRSRHELHGAVGGWLEERIERPSPETDDLIAYHWERSGTPERALPYLERGARAAKARGGLEDARAHLERALELCEDRGRRAGLLLEAEEAAMLAGDREGRRETLEALAELAAGREDPALLGEVALRRGRAALDAGDGEATRAAGREALARFGELEDVSKQGDAHRLLGREAHRRGHHPAADAHYQAALELERRAGDRRGEAEILDLRGMLQVDRDEYEAAVASFDRVVSICREIDAPLLEVRTLAHRAGALRWMGCLDEAGEDARGALERARAIGSPRARAAAELVLGGIHADAGRPREAEALLRRSLRAAVRMGRPALEARAWLELSWLEDGSRAAESAREAERAAGEAELVHVQVLAGARSAELALEAGDIAGADRASREAVERLGRHGTVVGPEERVLLTRRRVLDALGEGAEAGEMSARVERLVAERAERLGGPERRRAYLDRCRRTAEALGAPDPTGASVEAGR